MHFLIHGLKVKYQTATGYIKNGTLQIPVKITWKFVPTEYVDNVVLNVRVTDIQEQDLLNGKWYELGTDEIDFEELEECIEIRVEEYKEEYYHDHY